MLSRRSLFGLIPAPFAAGLGLLTTEAEPSPVPDSDPIAEAALEVEGWLGGLARIDRVHAERMAGKDPEWQFSREYADQLHRKLTPDLLARLGAAEDRLRPLLSGRRGLAIVVGGRVYAAGNVSRSPIVVEPVWVAMLTPAEGGDL